MSEDPQITPVKHYAMYGGMDQGDESHLLPENKWRFLQNMRLSSGLRQALRYKQLYSLSSRVDAIVNLPNGVADYGAWILIARNGVYRATMTGAVPFITFTTPSTHPFSSCVYNGRVYFVNPDSPVMSTDGRSLYYRVFEARQCWTRSNDEELIGSGPFTGHPLYDGIDPAGDLGHSFTWTEASYYRVYLSNTNLFPRNSFLSIRDRQPGISERSLSGIVISTHRNYVVVRATNTITNVSNIGKTLSSSVLAAYPRLVKLASLPVPSGRYVSVFYDHLVIGAPTYKGLYMPNKTMWSGLYDFAAWDPASNNEADSYTHSEFERGDDIVRGVTGQAHFADMLLIFTPSCVYAMQYTGLPRVMRVSPLIKDFGNGLPYAVAELHNSVVWCDVHHGSFYAFRGQGPEDIGKPIADYFFADVANDSEKLRLTKAVVDRRNHEVLWLYMSRATTSLAYDKAIVYDYANNAWSIRTVNDISAVGLLNKRGKAVNEFTEFIDDVDDIVDQAEDSGDQLREVVAGTYLARAELSTDTEASLDDQDAPVLETGDLLYGGAQTIKEVSSLWIDAEASNGLKVEVSTREFVDDEVIYVTVGVWTKLLAERVLTFQPQIGRILRYRFTPIEPVRNFVFRGFEDNVFNVSATR